MTSRRIKLAANTETAEQAERRNQFNATAEARYAHIVEGGETIPWEAMRRYLERRIVGKAGARPATRKPSR